MGSLMAGAPGRLRGSPPGRGLDGHDGASHPPPVSGIDPRDGWDSLPGQGLESTVQTLLVALDGEEVVTTAPGGPLGCVCLGGWRRRATASSRSNGSSRTGREGILSNPGRFKHHSLPPRGPRSRLSDTPPPSNQLRHPHPPTLSTPWAMWAAAE